VGPAAIWYVVLFVLGFLALASLWTVAGSLATSQEDLQSTTLPGQLLLFVPYFVAVSASDSVKEIFSMLPIVSTMIMPGRIAQGEAPLWQVSVAIAVTVVAAVVLLRVGALLYERTLLQTSRTLGYREAFRLPAR
jgi:ABC-2 type transport system permease protein